MVFPLVVHHDSKYSLIFWSDEVVFSKTLQTASNASTIQNGRLRDDLKANRKY
jgi:hypothetical protein